MANMHTIPQQQPIELTPIQNANQESGNSRKTARINYISTIVSNFTEQTKAKFWRCTDTIKAPARHLSLSWLSAFISLGFITLTVAYAFCPELVSHLKVIGGSPSSALLVLRILSEVASLMLGVMISAAFEDLQWILVALKGKLPLVDYLILQAGAGVPKLMGIVFLRRIKMMTRIWSVVKLVSIFLVPILNIVAMSNVQTSPVFYRVETEPAYGFGIGTFNASLAKLSAPATDLLYSTGFSDFISDSTRAIDITEPQQRRNCTYQNQEENSPECRSTVYVPGGVEISVQWDLESSGSPHADAFQAVDQQGYLFEFGVSPEGWTYDASKECHVYGSEEFAFSLCLKNGVDQVVQAHIGLCPRDHGNKTCFNDTSWRSGGGWRTSFKTLYRRATVAYNRINGTILSHKFSNLPMSDALINATDLLHVFDIIFGAENSTSTILDSPFAIFGSRKPALPYFIWWYFLSVSQLPRDDASANARAVAGLQSLLSLTMYHCQAKNFADLKRGLGYDNSSVIGRAILAAFPPMEADTPIYPATQRHSIVVGRGSLIAYTAMSGFTWILCLLVLLAGSFIPSERNVKDTTDFPTLDFCIKCQVQNENGNPVSEEQFQCLNSRSWKKQVRATGKMEVKLVQQE